MTLLKNCLIPCDQPVLCVRKTSTNRTRKSRAIALVIKINSSNSAVLFTYSEVNSNFVSLIKYLSAISVKHIVILSYFVLSHSTAYPLIFFTCCNNRVFLWLPCHPYWFSIKPTAVFPEVGYKAKVEVNGKQCEC